MQHRWSLWGQVIISAVGVIAKRGLRHCLLLSRRQMGKGTDCIILFFKKTLLLNRSFSLLGDYLVSWIPFILLLLLISLQTKYFLHYIVLHEVIQGKQSCKTKEGKGNNNDKGSHSFTLEIKRVLFCVVDEECSTSKIYHEK